MLANPVANLIRWQLSLPFDALFFSPYIRSLKTDALGLKQGRRHLQRKATAETQTVHVLFVV